jgi:hypothetical protein
MHDADSGLWNKTHVVNTNVSDTRDWFTFHSDAPWVNTALWRVRAVRATYGMSVNGVTTTSYGRWSPIFTTLATSPSASTITLAGAVSDTYSTAGSPSPHALMPGFSWSGVPDGGNTDLYRVYVFSDDNCVDPVLTGSIVGSPAWVPHSSGALVLPRNWENLTKALNGVLKDGDQGEAFDRSGHQLIANESGGAAARLDLWDRKWPSGTYYWTAVRVLWQYEKEKDRVWYMDAEEPQDVCAAGRVGEFGRVSQAIPTDGKTAFITALSRTGRMSSLQVTRNRRIWGTPLVTWTPVMGAGSYELQVSLTHNPFQAVASAVTPVTSVVLSLAPGTYYYRVRGLNPHMPAGAQQGMSWSTVRKMQVGKPSFRVLKK